MSSVTKTGKVTRIISDRGFAFIRCDNHDYFLHSTELKNCQFAELLLDDTIQFTPVETPKGPRAVEAVRLLED